MILFTILALIAGLVFICAVALLVTGGAAFIVLFGDLIVCVAIIWCVARLLSRRRKRR